MSIIDEFEEFDSIIVMESEDEWEPSQASTKKSKASTLPVSKRGSKGFSVARSWERVNPELMGETIKITGVVKRVFSAKETWCAGVLKLDAKDAQSVGMQDTKFNGCFYIEEGQILTLIGKFNDDNQWGIQFKADTFLEGFGEGAPLDVSGLAHFLASSKKFPGIGPAKAKMLASHYSTNFGEALETRLEEMAQVAKVALADMEEVRKSWRENSNYNETAVFLASFGLTASQIKKIVEAYKNGAKRILEKNPYVLIDAIDGFGFARVDEIAMKLGIAKNDSNRIEAAIKHAINQAATGEGHTWIPKELAIEQADKMLCMDTLHNKQLIGEAMTRLCTDVAEGQKWPHLTEFLANGVNGIAATWLLNQEKQVLGYIKALAGSPVRVAGWDALDERMNEQQKQAVRMAMGHRISLITGAAGTGKTFCIAEIIKQFQSNGLWKISLAAPTGMAAQRITRSVQTYGITQKTGIKKEVRGWNETVETETVYCMGQTIHKTLGYGFEQWEYTADNQLPCDLLICDEVSMLDIPLAWRLFQAIDPEKTRVILVGDQNQLPPVGPGNPLRDILTRGLIQVTHLTEIVRQSGELKQKCTEILQGRLAPTESGGTQDRQWFNISKKSLEGQPECAAMLVKLVLENVSNLKIPGVNGELKTPDLLKDMQVITPTHKGELGTVSLNHALQRVLQKKMYNVTTRAIPETSKQKRPDFLEGDKVIQTKNDYKLGVMNGTIGFISRIETTDKGKEILHIRFDDTEGDSAISGDARNNLAHAYALTIHKMQGSEVPIVIAIVHKAHTFQTHRNMIYTAATRAKNIVVLLGEPWGMAKAVERQVLDSRLTYMMLA